MYVTFKIYIIIERELRGVLISWEILANKLILNFLSSSCSYYFVYI